MIDPSVKDFPSLIQWLADKYHDGTVSAVGLRIGASPSTSNFWRRGIVMPNLEHLERLCDVYHLDFNAVRALVKRKPRRSRIVPIGGGSGVADGPHVVEILARLTEGVSLIRRQLERWWACQLLPVGVQCPAAP